MYKKIYDAISKFDNIIIARHVGPDPDAMSSTMALKDSILLTFPNKKCYVVGTGSNRFSYFGKLDKVEKVEEDSLLIVLDTPDIRRIDGAILEDFKKVIKIDHHPFVDKFSDLELIDEKASSAAELVLELIQETPLLMDQNIASKIYLGIVSDTNRFMFNNSTSRTFQNISKIVEKYKLDINKLYEPLYLRPLNEVRLEGYIGQNMIVTENKVGYIKLSNSLLEKYKVDAASPGNMINNFNYINEVLVWCFFTEDIKNENIRVSVRSRGPVINTILANYNGGGHKQASGARIKTMDEAEKIINDLNLLCENYIKESGCIENQ